MGPADPARPVRPVRNDQGCESRRAHPWIAREPGKQFQLIDGLEINISLDNRTNQSRRSQVRGATLPGHGLLESSLKRPEYVVFLPKTS